MYLLFETVKLADGVPQNLLYHNERMNRTRRELMKSEDRLDLESYINPPAGKGVYKCRVIYSERVVKLEYEKYAPKAVKTLKLVRDDSIEYPHKFKDRARLEELFAMRGGCDEILIVKNGLLTDTSYSNVVVFDGSAYYTPASPLLKGTKRQKLLDGRRIKERDIPAADLGKYQSVHLVNAMIDLEDDVSVPVANIVP